jgi:hypothetical protein
MVAEIAEKIFAFFVNIDKKYYYFAPNKKSRLKVEFSEIRKIAIVLF